jgi:hypothetical protein
MSYLQKNQTMVEEVFFVNYVSSVRFRIDRSDLICTPHTPDMLLF